MTLFCHCEQYREHLGKKDWTFGGFLARFVGRERLWISLSGYHDMLMVIVRACEPYWNDVRDCWSTNSDVSF